MKYRALHTGQMLSGLGTVTGGLRSSIQVVPTLRRLQITHRGTRDARLEFFLIWLIASPSATLQMLALRFAQILAGSSGQTAPHRRGPLPVGEPG